MTTSAPVPADHPLMVAWTAYTATEEFANTLRWASKPEHSQGSLWAAFEQGFRAAADQGEGWRPTHRHVKRGTEYEVIGWGSVQCSEAGLLDNEHVMIYRGQDGTLWARRLSEFIDGRFEMLS